MAYGRGTDVPVERSRMELDAMLAKAGAQQRMFGVNEAQAVGYVAFVLQGHQVSMQVPMPEIENFAFKPPPRKDSVDKSPRRRTPEEQRKVYEQACKERWRQFCLLVKAKLEAIELEISTVEREFLADLRLVDGRTVHQAMEGGLKKMLAEGRVPKALMLGMGGKE